MSSKNRASASISEVNVSNVTIPSNDYIIFFKSTHVEIFRTLFEIIKDIKQDTNITFYKKTEKRDHGYLEIKDISNGKTILFSLRIYEYKFIEYYCEHDTYTISLNLAMLYQLLKLINESSEIIFNISKHDPQNLHIISTNKSKTTLITSTMRLSVLNSQSINPLKVTHSACIKMNAIEFHKICKDMKILGSLLDIKCTNKEIIFSTGDNDANKCTYEIRYKVSNESINKSSAKITFDDKISDNAIIHAIYELNLLSLFHKCGSLTQHITIRLGSVKDQPICLEYSIDELGTFICFITPANISSDAR